jgi:IgGFc binding protein
MGKNEGPGTMLSSRAFRVTSSEPVVVYQFNAMKAAYSNDASLLIPTPALGRVYRALAWPSGLFNKGYVTIVGTEKETTVQVKVSQNVLGGAGIPATKKNGVIEVKLGPFDVLNLETDGAPFDLTGSVVTSSAPVAVFVGTELSVGYVGNNFPGYPPGEGQNSCCQDHVEEQLLPVESYGKQFAVPRSPPRGVSYKEPDSIRLLGIATQAQVKTNLPPPNNAFTLAPGQVRDFITDKNFVIDSSEPIAVGQVIQSAGFTEEGIGDPSLNIFPAIDQFRKDYLFLVPPSWKKNYVVISVPDGAKLTLDGAALSGCEEGEIGTLASVKYNFKRCAVLEGPHRIAGDQPFGIAAFGYGTAGSYSFVGGSNVKKIYEPPMIR